MQAILAAGLVCGVLDGLSAIALTLAFGGKPARMFQGIAAGLFGPSAFKGGGATAAMGVALHFIVALGASAVYFEAGRVFPVLIDQAVVSGMLYGVAVHLFMNFVVIPLSAAGRRPFVLRAFVAVLVVHIVVVGPSIALTVRYYVRKRGTFCQYHLRYKPSGWAATSDTPIHLLPQAVLTTHIALVLR
jgi:hypothetical protein